mmetsp:Transcript_18638/g.36875  ORF Transcript_18638/g.36875 Transcript_18638/m.36875 type:complete len:320 (-) Transcript_18638:540-1499(-)
MGVVAMTSDDSCLVAVVLFIVLVLFLGWLFCHGLGGGVVVMALGGGMFAVALAVALSSCRWVVVLLSWCWVVLLLLYGVGGAAGIVNWPDVAQGCKEAEEGLRRVRDILSDPLLAAGEEGGGGSGVLLARAALDSVGGKIEAAESLVTNGWQRVEQQKAEAGAATELCRAAISRAADAKDTASVLGLIELPSVASALEAAGLACQAAALSVHQKSSLPLAVVTDDCRRAVESAEELERCVDTQKAAREHFEEAERQRTGWNRADAAKKAEAAQAQARPRHCAAEEPARPAGVGAGLPRGEESRHAPGSSEPSLPRPRGR